MKRVWGSSLTTDYTVQKKGTSKITAGQSYKAVTHGLGGTPTNIKITPEDGFEGPFLVDIAQVGATTFRVSLSGGLTLPSDANFMWEACL